MSPSRFAVVVSPPPVPEPTSGSVRPKQPIFSRRAIGGSHFCFCSSEPDEAMESMARPMWTPKKVRTKLDPRHLHAQQADQQVAAACAAVAIDAETGDVELLVRGSSSNGKASSTQYLLMIGATLVSMKSRTFFTIARSSAVKRSAN